jgi:hypothetical protein
MLDVVYIDEHDYVIVVVIAYEIVHVSRRRDRIRVRHR